MALNQWVSDWLTTNTPSFYYQIRIIENSVNTTNTKSNVTVSVEAFVTNEYIYTLNGTIWCEIDGDTHSQSFTKQRFSGDLCTIFQTTLNIAHDDDGYKNLKVSAWLRAGAHFSDSQGFDVDLTPIHVPSQPSCITYPNTTQNIGEFGDEITIYMNNKRPSEYKHTVRLEFGYEDRTLWSVEEGTGVINNTKWMIPLDLMNEIPNATSGAGVIYVDTYSGKTLVGTRSVSFTVSVPEKIVPNIESVILTDDTGLFERYGKYVQGKSNLNVEINISGVYGSEIKSCNTVIDGKTYTKENFTIKSIDSIGDKVVKTVVTDTRNRTNILPQTISIYPYEVPKISNLKVTRCNSDGTASSKGGYLKAVFSVAVTSLENKNGVAYSIGYKKRTESNYTETELTKYANAYTLADAEYIFEADTSSSYDVILSVDDEITPKTKGAVGPSIRVLWSKLAKGLGFAIGKVAELGGVLDIAFKTRFEGGILQPVIPKGTDFDTLLTPNTYNGLNAADANYLNCPIENGTFTLHVTSAGQAETELIHHITRCIKGSIEYYERHYYDNAWGEWVRNLNMADYVIEYGTLNDWKYNKWKSGKVEAWHVTPVVNVEASAVTVLDIKVPDGIFTDVPAFIQPTFRTNTSSYNMGLCEVSTGNSGHTATNIVLRISNTHTSLFNPRINIYAVQF